MGFKYGKEVPFETDLLTLALEYDLFWGVGKAQAGFSSSGRDLEISFSDGSGITVSGYFDCLKDGGSVFSDVAGIKIGVGSFVMHPAVEHLDAPLPDSGMTGHLLDSSPEHSLAFLPDSSASPEDAEDLLYVNESLGNVNRESVAGMVLLEPDSGAVDPASFSLAEDYGALVAGTELLDLGTGRDMELFVDTSLGEVGVDGVLDSSLLDGEDPDLLLGLADAGAVTLRIVGDAACDSVKVGGDWHELGKRVSYDGISYDVFENNGEYLLIQNGLI